MHRTRQLRRPRRTPRPVLLLATLAAVLALVPATGHAQQAPASEPVTGVPESRPWPLVAAGGAAGGALGFGGGLYLGTRMVQGCDGGGCAFLVIFPPLVGGIVGTPLGAHLANGRRGDLTESIGLSVFGAIAGGYLVSFAGRRLLGEGPAETVTIVSIPIFQLSTAVAYERWMAGR